MPLGGSPKVSSPPPLRPIVKQVDVSQGRRAGVDERRRLRGRSRIGTVLAGRGQLQPAAVSRPVLKQRLGATN